MLHLPLGSTARSMAALCGYFSGFCALSMVSAAPPVIEDITPRGIAPGATQRLEIRGSDLGEITQIWTSFPARQHVVGSDAQQGAASEEPAVDPVRHSCQLSIARDEQVGVAAIRVATEAGVSPWQLLMIDDLPSLAETNDHDQRQNAQPVDWPLAIDGTSDALKSDYYRLEIVEPTELSFEVVAQRIASPLDAVLTLYDEAGEPLTVSDDDPGTGADSRFVFRFPSAGVYYLSLRDVQYRGGAEYRYRLRVGRFPLIRCVYPLGARAKSVVDFEFLGLDGALLGRQNLLLGRLASCTAQGQLGLSLKLPGHDASGFTSIAAGGMLESVLEREPNDAREQANALPVPGVAYGRFEQAADSDVYHWTADSGQRLIVTAESQRYGSAADVYLRLWDESGKMLAEASGQGLELPRLAYTATQAGKYFLSVEDLQQSGGAGYAYRLAMENQPAGFTLATASDTYNVPHKGTLVVKVTAKRTDYKGPIELSLQAADGGALEGLTLEQFTLAEAANEVELKAQLPESWQPGELRMVRIVGRAANSENAGGKTNSEGNLPPEVVGTLPALQARGLAAFQLPQFLDGEIALAITQAVSEEK